MSVAVKGLEAFDATVQGWFAAVEKAAAEAAIGLAKRTFEKLLIESPQYSGDFTANWKVEVNSITPSFKMDAVSPDTHSYAGTDGIKGFAPFGRGDSPAMIYARAHAAWPTSIKLGDKIFLHNTSSHPHKVDASEGVIDMYSWKIENGMINFRPVNQGADHVARRSMNFVANRYTHIGSAQLGILRRVGT